MTSCLVTGGAGYIGSNLINDMLSAGKKVVVLDKLLFGIDPIASHLSNRNLKLIIGDISIEEDINKALELNVDNVIHLAAIVGDPACAANQHEAIKTNIDGTLKLATICKSKGVKRFIFASTCSVYGASGNILLDEGSKTNPVSLYAKTRLTAENEILKMVDGDFMPTILRFGTIYGISPRMRFDLIINFLTLKAIKEKKIRIFGGDQWRPFVHVRDIGRALLLMLNSPAKRIGGEIFNVGDTSENYLLSHLGDIVKRIMPDVEVSCLNEIKDERSYRVSFEKIKKAFGFTAGFNVKDGIIEIKNTIESKLISNPDDKKFYNYKQYT